MLNKKLLTILFLFFVLVGNSQKWTCFPISDNAGVSANEVTTKKKWISATGKIAYYDYLSVVQGEKSQWLFQHDSLEFWKESLVLFCPELNKRLTGFVDQQGWHVELPELVSDITFHILYENIEQKRYYVDVQKERLIRIQLIPICAVSMNLDSIENYLNTTFQGAHLRFELTKQPRFQYDPLNDKPLKHASIAFERYSSEMIRLRDQNFAERGLPDESMVIFIVPGFDTDSLDHFCVKNRSLGFIETGNLDAIKSRIAKVIFLGPGARFQSTSDVELNYDDWKNLRRYVVYHNFNDDYEDLPSANGMVAYYFWEEDALGNIVLKKGGVFEALKRPYKQNTYSYHLEINHFFYRTLFVLKGYRINLLHVGGALIILLVWWIYGRKVRRWIQHKWHFNRLFRFLSHPLFFCCMLLVQWGNFKIINWGYRFYEVTNGEIKELKNKSESQVIERIALKKHPRILNEKKLQSEIVVRSSNGTFNLKQRQPVLYFEAVESENGNLETLRLVDAKDSLILPTLHVNVFAKSHYFVVRFKNSSGLLVREKVFNYQGVELTDVLKSKDPAQRILIFVNGYRATSLGTSFQENVNDVKNKGLEFPNSTNHLYDFDRFHYWHPWNQIDSRFIAKFAPQRTLYADGHFSVATSNYKSLVNFTTTSTAFPKRCANPKKHHCYWQTTVRSKYLGSRKKSTYSLINYSSNKTGFKRRFKNGQVAGKNVLAMLNELPNASKNDTLFIVAHSMGYAYALGMIEELRGKIQFGSFIIIAPENAAAGKVYPFEWKEIWQYGSNNNKGKNREAPCLQDGVAPQFGAKGLPQHHRLYIPKKWFKKKGFFDSHFVGYYTWIFDISPSKPGFIQQHQ